LKAGFSTFPHRNPPGTGLAGQEEGLPKQAHRGEQPPHPGALKNILT